MALFPRIQGPCPYIDNLAAVMDGDHCRVCKRTVTDLTDMTDGERTAFLSRCEGAEVCVSYRLPRRIAVAAALSFGAIAAPLAAAACPPEELTDLVITGGAIKPAHAQFLQVEAPPETARAPRLPVVYEDPPPAPPAAHDAAHPPAPDVAPSATQVVRTEAGA